MPADYQEHMLKNMDDLVPLVGKLAGEKERQITSLAKDNYDQYKDEVDGRIEAARTKFAEQYETYTQQVSSTMAEITGNFKSFLDQANTQNEGIAGQNQEILARQKELEAQLGFSTSLYERNNDISSENVFGTDNIDPGWYGENAGGDSGFIKVNGYEEAGKKQDEAVHSLKEETEVKGDKKNKMDDKQHSLL